MTTTVRQLPTLAAHAPDQGGDQPRSPDHAAVQYILTSPPIASRTAPYIGGDDFDWPGLLAAAETMSGGERLLLRIAQDLWEGKSTAAVWEIPRKLSQSSFERVLLALRWCHGDLAYSPQWQSGYPATPLETLEGTPE